MRLIYVNGEFVEPRYVVRTKHAVGDVSLDNCQLVDPCKRPDACEHGGKCSIDVDRVVCDCVGTGYIGKNCHFGKIFYFRFILKTIIFKKIFNVIKLYS